ncbi:hypothetical protein GCM10017673_24540 [Streptosporangium violaceochromogenes]|nr:hypothetical protein GCM10017673_24540 [Streptosporangium violaceochromogenes]
MKDRRVLLPLLFAAGLSLAGCGLAAEGAGGEAGGAPRSSARTGAERDDGVRPLRDGAGRAVAPGEAEATGGFALPVEPLPLALAAGALAAAGSALYLWRRGGRPAQATAARPDAFAGPATAPPPPPHTPSPHVPSPPRGAAAEGAPRGPVPPPTVPAAAAPAGPPDSPGARGSDPLAEALAEVAGSGISQALTQQVERLFAEGHPGRAALVTACIGCRDQIAERHPRLSGLLLEGLNRAGVREIVADGHRFDPRLHEAFGTEPTERPELHDIVAETVKRGYADGDRLIRVPQVAVYRHEPSGRGTAP